MALCEPRNGHKVILEPADILIRNRTRERRRWGTGVGLGRIAAGFGPCGCDGGHVLIGKRLSAGLPRVRLPSVEGRLFRQHAPAK
jgi:hypothetical protein